LLLLLLLLLLVVMLLLLLLLMQERLLLLMLSCCLPFAGRHRKIAIPVGNSSSRIGVPGASAPAHRSGGCCSSSSFGED